MTVRVYVHSMTFKREWCCVFTAIWLTVKSGVLSTESDDADKRLVTGGWSREAWLVMAESPRSASSRDDCQGNQQHKQKITKHGSTALASAKFIMHPCQLSPKKPFLMGCGYIEPRCGFAKSYLPKINKVLSFFISQGRWTCNHFVNHLPAFGICAFTHMADVASAFWNLTPVVCRECVLAVHQTNCVWVPLRSLTVELHPHTCHCCLHASPYLQPKWWKWGSFFTNERESDLPQFACLTCLACVGFVVRSSVHSRPFPVYRWGAQQTLLVRHGWQWQALQQECHRLQAYTHTHFT